MESIDVLDKNGNLVGLTKSRDEIHRDGDWHRAVNIWIKNNHGDVLVQKRSAMIDLFKNRWDVSLTGHVRAGEKNTDAAQRELKEELGIETDARELQFIDTIKSKLKDGVLRDNQFCDIYLLCGDINFKKVKKQKEEVAQTKSVPLAKLETFIQKNSDNFVPRREEYKKMLRYLQSNFKL
ncbi:MAG: NUDIX domain-containing protein [Patescibacteria group bacterium]|nr:NUDIX domain-containing protein [Patescibacteria group bacterium]